MIKTKQIAFNLNDPLQRELFDYVCKFKNFSFYGKNLIQKDICGSWAGTSSKNNNIELSSSKLEIDADIAKSFI